MASTERRHALLNAMGHVAPLVPQLLMLLVMLVSRQWMFAAMLAPGVLAYAASLFAAVQRRRIEGGARATPRDHVPSLARSSPRATKGAVRSISDIDCPTLESLLGIGTKGAAAWRSIVLQWLRPPSKHVPVGMGETSMFTIDLANQGPHALIAGTTGSGKSVLLQSWCLSLALRNSPERINFVFLDFKGGSAFSCFDSLPHTVGSVCDLNLKQAIRALRSLEAELKRREALAAHHHVGDISALAVPPPDLVVMVDEFHALRSQLPDYVDRLVHIAALGRSLGMHVIVCTQNPLGQVSADMKANMTLNICLRVRDAMQSKELLGSGEAAAISPQLPGGGLCYDGDSLVAFRCAEAMDIEHLVDAARLASRYCGYASRPSMFTAPLPRRLSGLHPYAEEPSAAGNGRVAFALADDGVSLSVASLPVGEGNIAVIGAHGRGKSTVLRLLAQRLAHDPRLLVRLTCKQGTGFSTRRPHRTPSARRSGSAMRAAPKPPVPQPPHVVWLIDDADSLLDPFNTQELAESVRKALHDAQVTVIVAAESARHLRAELYATRLVFPGGERDVDMMHGIPSHLLASFDSEDLMTPGRAVLISHGAALPVQCQAAVEIEHRRKSMGESS